MNSETVKPMPVSAAPPSTSAGPTPRGSWPRRARAATRLVAPTPISLPTTRPRMTPRPTLEVHALRSVCPSICTPALARAKSGTTTKLVQGCSSSWRRSLGDTARSTLELGRAGELRHGRLAEGLRQDRRPLDLLAARAGTRRCSTAIRTPAMAGWTPDSSIAAHSTAAHREVGRAAPHLQPAERQDHEHARPGQQERQHRHVVGVEERDDRERGDVVHDRQRQQEDAQLGGGAGAHQRQHAEGEGGVGRDRDAPAPAPRRPTG